MRSKGVFPGMALAVVVAVLVSVVLLDVSLTIADTTLGEGAYYHWPLGWSGTGTNYYDCSEGVFTDGKILDNHLCDNHMITAPVNVKETCAMFLGGRCAIDLGNFEGTCVSDLQLCKTGGFTWSVWLTLDLHILYNKEVLVSTASTEKHHSSFVMWIHKNEFVFCSTYYNSSFVSIGIDLDILYRYFDWFFITCTFEISSDGVNAQAFINGIKMEGENILKTPSFVSDSNLTLGESKNWYNAIGYSNLVVTDGVLKDEEIRHLYECGSMDWNPSIRSLFQKTTGIDQSDVQLTCSASDVNGPSSVTWRVYQSKCRMWKDLNDETDCGVRVSEKNISSCVLTSTLTISNFEGRGFEGAVIVCSSAMVSANVTIKGTKQTSADFTTPLSRTVPSGKLDQGDDDTLTSLFDSVSDQGDDDLCGGERVLEKDDKVIKVAALTAGEGEYNDVGTELDGKVFSVQIPGFASSNVSVIAVVSVYKPDSESTPKFNGKQVRFGSPIIDVEVITANGAKLTNFSSSPIKIAFPAPEIREREVPVCSYQSEDDPYWHTDGCRVSTAASTINESDVTCICNHLTNFAVLMQFQELPMGDFCCPKWQKTYQGGYSDGILDLLTKFGLSISIACLAITLFVYAFYRMNNTRFITHANLAFSLMTSHIIFFFIGTEDKGGCTAVAILLHFFLLAAFTWMALEGAFLYMKSSPTFRWKIRLPVWLLIGWGCPLVIVAISIAVRVNDYTRNYSCWLSFKDGFNWSFLAPVLVVITGNTFVLIRLVIVFMSLKTNQDKTERMKMKAGLRLVLVLEPLLGLPWIFGFVFPENKFFSYLFVIFNSLQGLFVFLSQCVFDKEIRLKFRQKKSKVESISITQEPTKSTATTQLSGF